MAHNVPKTEQPERVLLDRCSAGWLYFAAWLVTLARVAAPSAGLLLPAAHEDTWGAHP